MFYLVAHPAGRAGITLAENIYRLYAPHHLLWWGVADVWREACSTVPPGQRSRPRTGCLSRLRAAKGLSAAFGCHPEPIRFAQGKLRERSARGAQRCFAALSMTARTAVKAAQVRSQEKSSLQMPGGVEEQWPKGGRNDKI